MELLDWTCEVTGEAGPAACVPLLVKSALCAPSVLALTMPVTCRCGDIIDSRRCRDPERKRQVRHSLPRRMLRRWRSRHVIPLSAKCSTRWKVISAGQPRRYPDSSPDASPGHRFLAPVMPAPGHLEGSHRRVTTPVILAAEACEYVLRPVPQ